MAAVWRLMPPQGTIGVVSVATNRYAQYWMAMARTADEYLFPGHELTLHVFTDRADELEAFASELTRAKMNVVRIDGLTWPAAPLMKFQTIHDHADQLGQELLMYLDADMLVVRDTGDELRPEQWAGGMALVRHPGYRRPAGRVRWQVNAEHPSFLLRDAYCRCRDGAIGTWESNRRSTAFVPRGMRTTYVCGATWLGRRSAFLATCELLATRTAADQAAGAIAVWHDESHLNWYAATHACSILDSGYCYAEHSPMLRDLEPRIIAVDKFDDRTR